MKGRDENSMQQNLTLILCSFWWGKVTKKKIGGEKKGIIHGMLHK
jgi:hypothetical protein